MDKYTYRVTWSEEDHEYVGLCAEFPSLSWLAKNQAEALAGIQTVVGESVRDLKASGEKIPEPFAIRQFSGKFQVRIPPELHRKLYIEAAEEKVSVNRLISAKLAI